MRAQGRSLSRISIILELIFKLRMEENNFDDIKKELQQAKEDLNDVASYLDDFLIFLPLAVCDISVHGTIIDVNKSFEMISGFSALEISGTQVPDIFLEKSQIGEILNLTKKRGVLRNKELILISKDKKKIFVNASFSARKDKDDNFTGYFLGLLNITSLKALQHEMEKKIRERTKDLEKSKTVLANTLEDVEKTRGALMNMLEDFEGERKRAEEEKDKTLAVINDLADGLLVFDRESKLLLVNPQAEFFLNIKTEEVAGNSILELAKLPNLKALMDLVGIEIKGIFRKEVQVKESLVLEVNTIPMMREEEKLGSLIILHDITREKIVERIKTEFVSLAAHQLRTPLSAIKWTLCMLLDGDLGEITKEQRDFIEKTHQSNERMISLVNDLLDVTRIEEGRYVYKPTPVNLEDLVRFVVNSYKEEINRKNLRLEFKKTEAKLPKIEVDVEKIRLIIQNFLDNAIKYTPNGGTVLISLTYDKGKKEIKFSIKDTGVGIPQDQQERVFTKFFRGANVIRMATEGSGLGLFIAKNIIEAHGGKIWFESKENQGTIFYFALPVKKEFE